jgi:serine/threonine protein kinase/Flp pilus assembly protein TadD
MPLPNGTSLGRYQVQSLLGIGGMGEVYLAEDTQLGRKVALKLLPAEFTTHQSRLRRFEKEACAASSLNHPNILTIHEIGSADGTHFITMEFIEGVTLRQHSGGKQLPLREVLDISIQVASALTAAHAAGIVHRDLKPENIMLRPDGYVKVLDFGIAKLAEKQEHRSDPEAATIFKTEPGIIMGTANYMSPEQARGFEVDARTDIWSLGVVAYEMITGRLPFEGQTSSDVISEILQKEPLAIRRHDQVLPVELERIIGKALTKDREERYQTTKDLLIDLKRLKQQLHLESEIERTVPVEERAAKFAIGDSSEFVEAQTKPSSTDRIETPRPTSNIEYLVSRIKRHKSLMIIGAAVIIAAAIFSYLYFARADKAHIDSIAVLPFVNASADPNMEYLSEGITDNIADSLSQLPALRVVPLSKVSRYKNRDVDPQDVGNELGVRAVLVGRVMQRGDTLNIRAELVDVAHVSRLWGGQYNRKLSDILAVQEEIAREISETLRMQLSGEAKKRLTKRYTENIEAYQLYLRGRYFWNRRTDENLRKAVELFQQAIDKDPNYALAYTGLADSYALLGGPVYGAEPSSQTVTRAKTAALKALEIDNTLAEAYTSLGYIASTYEWDFPSAERNFKRALELNPSYATAHHWYGLTCLSYVGRHDEAIIETRRAAELDPLSLINNASYGRAYYYARQYDKAIEQFRKTVELDPSFVRAHLYLGWTYEAKGMFDEAIAEYVKARALDDSPVIIASLAHALAVSGKRDEAQKLLDELNDLSHRRYVSAYDLALIHTGLAENDRAFEFLQKAYQERSSALSWLGVDPRLDRLRSDQRFVDLLRRIGLST